MRSLLVAVLGMLTCAVSLAQANPGVSLPDQSRGAPAPTRAPAGWADTFARGTQMILDGKPAEAAALFEKVLQTSPDFAEAHYELGGAHTAIAESLKTAGPSQAAARRGHLETAATHYQRAIDLASAGRYMALKALAELNRKDGLNRLTEAERYARQLVRERPTAVVWHDLLARILTEAGRDAAATEALHAARAMVSADEQIVLGMLLAEQVIQSPQLAGADTRIRLEDALAIADEALKREPTRADLFQLRSVTLQLQATRVEQNAARKKALQAEADKAFEQFRALNTRARAADETVEGKWSDAEGRGAMLEMDGKPAEANAIYEKFVQAHPDFTDAHYRLALSHEGLATAMKGAGPAAAATRVRRLELAATHYQRAINLAGTSAKVPPAMVSLIHLLAPDGLNRAAEREALARRAIKDYPTDPTGHYALLGLLLTTGRSAEVDGLLRTARTAIPATAELRGMMGTYLFDLVSRDPKLPVADARKLLNEAVAVLDDALKLNPDYLEGLTFKALVLKQQAARTEPDPDRAKALMTESDRLLARAKTLRERRD